MNTDELKLLAKNTIPELAKHLSTPEIASLVQTLGEKDDALRYNAFLLLQVSSTHFPFVYKYWGELSEKLESINSYQKYWLDAYCGKCKMGQGRQVHGNN